MPRPLLMLLPMLMLIVTAPASLAGRAGASSSPSVRAMTAIMVRFMSVVLFCCCHGEETPACPPLAHLPILFVTAPDRCLPPRDAGWTSAGPVPYSPQLCEPEIHEGLMQ